jgi:tetratricopeptide (TPR) repeat protein
MEIQSGQAQPAAQKFQILIDKNLTFRDLRAYRIWAGLSIDRNYNELTLEMIPPEERHSAAFMMAKGMLFKSRGQIKKALEAFRAAQVLDPRLTAKAELENMVSELERKGGQMALVKEISSLIDGWFGKSNRRGA